MVFKELFLGSVWNQMEYGLNELRMYVFAMLFAFGNIALPYVAHQFQLSGRIFLPIYLFILIGAYKYGWKVGVIAVVVSVFMNNLLTGMPSASMVPIILVKGILLAVFAFLVAKKTSRLSILHLLAVVLAYQIVGTVFEFILTGNLLVALTDITLGYPGLLLQVFLGYLVLRLFGKYDYKKYAGNS